MSWLKRRVNDVHEAADLAQVTFMRVLDPISNGYQKLYGANANGGSGETLTTTGSPAGNGSTWSDAQ